MNGFDSYGSDGQTTHPIATAAISGRVPGSVRAEFVGQIDFESGRIRIDAVNIPEFWIELKLDLLPAFSNAPGAPGAHAAQADFEAQVQATKRAGEGEQAGDGSDGE